MPAPSLRTARGGRAPRGHAEESLRGGPLQRPRGEWGHPRDRGGKGRRCLTDVSVSLFFVFLLLPCGLLVCGCFCLVLLI